MRTIHIVRVPLGIVAGLLGLVLTVPAILILFPFALVELWTRRIRRFLEPRPVEWEGVIDHLPQLGWKPKPDLDVHVRDFNGDTYHVTTGRDGWRGHNELAEADVVVFGDSYSFGCGVDDADFFAHQGSEIRIKAIGSPAYSMVHSLLWMERLAAELGDKLVVWFVYHGNDLADNLNPALLHYRSPFVRPNHETGDWEIVDGHVNRRRWTINSREGAMEEFVELCSPGYRSTRTFEACEFLIRRGAEVCRAAGAELVVMTIPDLSPVAELALDRARALAGDTVDFDRGLPDRMVKDICGRASVRSIALGEHLDASDYLQRDFHWSPRGNRRVSEILGDLSRHFAHASRGEGPSDTLAIDLPRRTG